MKIKDFFDDFAFHARVMPVLVIFCPIFLIGIFNGIIYDSWVENTFLMFICLVFLTITSKIARNLGKEYETKMYKKLGGIPSTIVLRFSDSIFDSVTKQRYHKKLNKIEGIKLPLQSTDEVPEDDEQYTSAATMLRNYANSHRETEQRVYQELKEYNFWRNLYGTKWFALLFYLVIAIREIILKKPIALKQVLLCPYPDYITLLILLLSIVILAFFVNQKVVQQKAFDYAKTLIEVCERIPEGKQNKK